ncbi:33315_t:CDS:2 [Gigaspora margarita]|uniref:33315_t:CDS:1 n=1 Tax=Gigaspora margarita TaxID=4874 RepID=A0ABM8W5R8_GIGMA|nr:33315_t:CDS:2 [Gigaspora margarita]
MVFNVKAYLLKVIFLTKPQKISILSSSIIKYCLLKIPTLINSDPRFYQKSGLAVA